MEVSGAIAAQHRSTVHRTHPIERLTKDDQRRTDVVGISANEGPIIPLIGAVLLESSDERCERSSKLGA